MLLKKKHVAQNILKILDKKRGTLSSYYYFWVDKRK
jgi:hypothetical protein